MKKPVWNNNILVLGLFLCFLAVAPVRSSAAFSGRIVSLAPSVTECLFSLGSGDLVAGVTDHDVFPEEVKELPSVGGYFDPSLEKILSLSPDLVIGISTFHGRLLERLESMGVKTLPLTVHRGLEGVGDSLHSIGEKIGKRAMAEDLWRDIMEKIDLVAEDVKRSFPGGPPSLLVVVWHDPLTVAGGVNFIDDILTRIGIPNAAGDINYTFPQLDPEGVIIRDPDIILVPRTERGMSLSPDVLENALKGLPIRAVEEGRIVSVSADLLFHPGPRVAEAAMLLLGSIMQFEGLVQ
ncbi:MAG TPA: helical backbone metal receptor [Synergistales bacterium]|jgi:iron complex transport system substrate-binding protein|nr:helical backbone metal receptor [Synergistales bacterium]HRV70499.1 helical backbone metal receptor [Thermovirgaceae bacterium]